MTAALTPGDKGRLLTLALLVLLAIASLGLGLAAVTAERDAFAPPEAGGLLFPDLAANSEKVASIKVETRGTVTTLSRQADGSWAVADRDNYPAKGDSVRRLVLELSQITLIEPRTADPARHAALALGAGQTGETRIVTLAAADGTAIASAVLGKIQTAGDGEASGTMFVRRSGEDQTWLARGLVGTPQTTGDWLDPTLWDLADAQFRTATISPRGLAPYTLERPAPDQPDFVIKDMPEGRKAQEPMFLNGVGNALKAIRFDDVRRAEGLDTTLAAKAVFTTFDGLTVEVVMVPNDGATVWAIFAASAAPDADADMIAKAEAITKRTSGWAYNLPQIQAANLATPLDALLQPAEAAPAQPAPPAPPQP
jgi:hypothetical protein